MHVRLMPLDCVTEDDMRSWRRLADSAAEPNVYLDPRFLVPARTRGDETSDLRIVVAEEDGEWLAALAVTIKVVGRGLPLRSTTTGGAFTTPHSDRHHPLVRTGCTADALEALLRGLTAVGLPGLLQLDHFPTDGPLADALAEVVDRSPILVHERRRSVSAFAVRGTMVPPTSPTSGAEPPLDMAHLQADDRQNMRRRVRGLTRSTGGPLEIHDLSSDPKVDDQFVDLQSAGWKGDPERGGAALRLSPPAERWFRDVTAGFRRDGDLLAVRLAAGGQTLWIGYALRSGGSYFGFLDAYAEEHARCSPGSIGRIALMSHVFRSTDAAFFDPAFDARYTAVARLFPDRRGQADLLLSTRGLGPRAVLRAIPVARQLGLVSFGTSTARRSPVARARAPRRP